MAGKRNFEVSCVCAARRWSTPIRALLVRIAFATHSVLTIWRLCVVTGNDRFWYLQATGILLLLETIVTLKANRGDEWKR